MKIAKRKAERKLRAKRKTLRKLAHEKDTSRYLTTLSQIDVARAEYVARRIDLVECIAIAKSTYFQSQIEDCGNDQKRLFAVINNILHKKPQDSLPDHDSSKDLAETFNHFSSINLRTFEKS